MSWLDKVAKYESCDDCPWPGVCNRDGTCWEQVTREEQLRQEDHWREIQQKGKK